MRLLIPIALSIGKGQRVVPPGIENEIIKPIDPDISIKPVTLPTIPIDDDKPEDTDVGQFNPDPIATSTTSEPITIHTGIEDLFGDDIDLDSLWNDFDESKIPIADKCSVGDTDEGFEEPEIKDENDFEKDSIEVLKDSKVVFGSLLPVEMFKDVSDSKPKLLKPILDDFGEIGISDIDDLVKPTKFPVSLNTISLQTLQTVKTIKTTKAPTIEPIKDYPCLAGPLQEVIDISAIDSSDSISSGELDKESFWKVFFVNITI